jgi:CHAT domain-containing protein
MPAINRDEAKCVIVTEPHVPDMSPLSMVSQEVDVIRSTLNDGLLTIIGDPGREAKGQYQRSSVASTLKQLPGASLVHMACHGQQDRNNPLESGFILSDGLLTVRQLMQLNLTEAYFAFLSACETAKGDVSQPDQNIHLAAAMLFAGFRTIVGTMW